MLVLTEEQWFDKYYPKEWGNWREAYNIKAYQDNGRFKTGCTWLNYRTTGYLYSQDENGLMKVYSSNRNYIDSCLFEVSSSNYVADAFCAATQPDKTKWVQGIMRKKESNLDLYSIKLFGIDDTSYTKDFIGLDSLIRDWNKIPYVLSNWDNLKKEDYYFTN